SGIWIERRQPSIPAPFRSLTRVRRLRPDDRPSLRSWSMTGRFWRSLKPSKTATAVLAGICAFAACLALAENAQPTAPKDERRSQVYAELAKAPEKARNRTNPLASDP